MDFVTGGDLLWIMDFSQKQRFEVENILMMDLFLTRSVCLHKTLRIVWIIVMCLSVFGLSF